MLAAVSLLWVTSAAHEAQDVTDAVVELGDHQLLPLLRALRSRAARSASCKITSSRVTRRPSAICSSAEVQGADWPYNRFLPQLKTLARGEAGAERAPEA